MRLHLYGTCPVCGMNLWLDLDKVNPAPHILIPEHPCEEHRERQRHRRALVQASGPIEESAIGG